MSSTAREEMVAMMGGWYHDGIGWGGWIMMILAMSAFWGVVVFAIIALLRGAGDIRNPSAPAQPRQAPQEILAERFARGEIDADEYRTRSGIVRDGGSDAST